MSQNDLSIADQAGAAFRSDLNNALQALGTLQSGATAPATTYAYMYWLDTTTGQLKQRNAANSGWIVRATAAESFVLSRSSNTILAEADRGKLLIATGSYTQTLTAAATLGDGWAIDVIVDAGATLVIDPNSSETIDGAATKTIVGPAQGRLVCNGTLFRTLGLDNGIKIITSTRANDGATGNVAYTGVGFKPRAVICLANVSSTRFMSFGFFTAAAGASIADLQSVAGGYFSGSNVVLMDETTGSKSQSAALSSMDADGFTLAWTRTGATAAGTIELKFLCFQ